MRGIIKFIPPLIVVGLALSGNLLAHPSAKPVLTWSKGSEQSIKFERISLEQGLSVNNVRCVFQDSKGFMWFGTWDGLNRYDGYRFTVYKHDPENPNSLSASSVFAIGEDKWGGLWIGTDDGLNKFDRETETFMCYKNDPKNPYGLSGNSIFAIYKDQAEVLWIGTLDGGLNKLVPTKSGSDTQDPSPKFIHYKNEPNNPNSLSSNGVSSIYEDRAGVLWIGTWGGGLNKFDRETETFARYQSDPNNFYSLSHNTVHDICEDQSGNLWLATGQGLNKLVPTKSGRDNQGYPPTFLHYRADSNDPKSLSDNVVRSICLDHSGMLWIGTEDSGLNRFDPQKEEFTHYKNEPGTPNSLSHNGVYSLYVDRSGVLWIGTFGGGVNKFYPKRKNFLHYKIDPGNPNSLSHNFVTAIYEDRSGTLWIGTWGGGLNKVVRSVKDGYPPTYTHYKNEPGKPNSLSNNIVRSIYEDQSGTLWIGTRGGGLNKFDPQKEKFTHYKKDPGKPNSLVSNRIHTIYEDKSGMLWIGTEDSGLNKFDPQKEKFTHYKNEPGTPNSLSHNHLINIYADKSGVLWIGTGDGLNKFDRETETFTHYKNDPGNRNSLSHNAVNTIYEDKSGMLWVGTVHGLNKFDRTKEIFTRYKKKDGLPDDWIYGILEDDHGNLWVSTNKGISKFTPPKSPLEGGLRGVFRNYDVRDGLQSNEFNGGAYYKSKSGEMFFGGVNGFNAFFPDQIEDNPHAPEVVITDFQIFNHSVPIAGSSLPEDLDSRSSFRLQQSITTAKELALSYKENVFSFEFAALHYVFPEKNQYAYKMEGFDENWNDIGTRRFVTFTNLDPGEYTFRVKASNSDGVWNKDGASIKIIITPPWWQTWWAYTFYIIAVGATLYGIRRFELSRTRLKHELELEHIHAEKLEEIDRMKSRFFANISHEFRTPLTLILGPLEKLLSDKVEETVKKQFRVMLRNGRRLLRLTNQLLDLSKLEAGSMSLKTRPENIIPLLKGIVLSFSSLAERKRITLRFQPPQPSEGLIVYVDRDKLEKIVSNLLSNAFKFTPEGGEISVAVSTTQSHAEITVADSGVGIPNEKLEKIFDRFYQADDSYTREQEGSGIGLALTKELVELHRGEIRVTSEPGMGTAFTVCLPLGKDHLKAEEEIAETPPSYSPLEGGLRGVSSPSSEEILEEATTGSDALPIVLIVEDNGDVRTYIRDYLEKEYQIMEAVDGEEGFEKSAEAVPDLIISDVMMPRMDGHELCRKLKTDERTSHIPVILLTARAGGESKVEGLETGADDYIIKPFDARELQVRVKNLIEQRRKLRERFRKEINLQPKDIAVTSMDEEFLQKAIFIIEENLSDPEFSTEEFAKKVALSRSQLHRKLRALTDYPTHEFIRMYRLKRAAQLLQHHAGTVTEICYDVGFNSLSHFAKAFRELFGQSPSEFAASHAGED